MFDNQYLFKGFYPNENGKETYKGCGEDVKGDWGTAVWFAYRITKR